MDCPECGCELDGDWCYECMASYPQPSVEDVQAAFARYRAEAELVINGLIGAMPPALQRRWPNIIARARRLPMN